MKDSSITEIFIKLIKTIFFLTLSTLPSFLLNLASLSGPDLSMNENWVITIMILLITLALVYFLFSYYRKQGKNILKKIGWKDLAIAFTIFIFVRLSVVINVMINEWINGSGSSLSSNDVALQQFESSVASFPMYLLMFNFIVAIVGPILEELAFRGIFADIWFDSPKNIKAAIFSSIIFTLAHGYDDLITFLMYLIMAFGFYYAYYRRGNILDSILVHIFNNAFVVLTSLFLI